ncbi:MAG: putative ApbE-like thiamine biosynthesis lipoprotein, partial [Nocardioidaceae bacterium]|nr:putative ApbE-like thiamine biosynthesis lipoprotein [Nocardioidaceae bacterium]
EALVAAWLSDGAVDPTVGSAMRAIGYDRDIADVRRQGAANPARIRTVTPAPGWESLRLDGDRLLVPEGVLLDLGATAKAVTADRAAAAVHARLGTGVLVNLGGDIATAGPGPENGWQVTVQDLPDDAPQRVTLTPGAAIATSSTARRTWHDGDRVVHHLIDPATGLPTRGRWRAATVVAADCARANTAATGALVKGDTAAHWLRQLGLPARLVDVGDHVRTLNDFPTERAA